MNIEVTSADYRNGNSQINHPIKVNGVYKVGDVTFKRGLIGATDLYEWIDAIRTGHPPGHPAPSPSACRTRRTRARLDRGCCSTPGRSRYTAPSLNAKTGTDVAIEELVLSIEDLIVE